MTSLFALDTIALTITHRPHDDEGVWYAAILLIAVILMQYYDKMSEIST